ncbi:DNA translocase FtsK 4TM domain-containing protein [Roseomonas sp. SG15]|uniref:DNA translocase FtsK n=2 Tax=Roseomonas indoligenes TaxID=2820811 RepID=A0A940MXV0_9PROT|nr:DNA translocase FtsK [Pararoseomonas indoligenes]MBP0494106.1 DNA translocase FtsK 4TM domain-containing protein [Pararoseomonas indoligenes]
MNPFGTAAGIRRFASPAVRAALTRRGAQLLGMIAGLLGLAVLVALASHNPGDPSLSTATSRAPTNLAGPFGAMVSDVLLQGFGWAGLLPAACLLTWALRLSTHRGLSPFPLRVAALLAGLPLLAAVLSVTPLPAPFPGGTAGGAVGPLMRDAVDETIGAIFGPLGSVVGNSALAAMAVVATVLALAVPLSSWRRAGGVAARRGHGLAGNILRRRSQARARAAEARMARARMHHHEAAPEERPGLLARVMGAPSRFGESLAGMIRRRQEPSPQLSQLLRAADAAAEEEPAARPAPRRVPKPAPEAPMERVAERMAEEAKEGGPRIADRVLPPRRLPIGETVKKGDDGKFRLPPLSLLAPAPPRRDHGPSREALEENARLLESVLEDYGVRGKIADIRPGPVVTLYELEPAPGTKSARVIGLADDIARSMSVLAVRIATVPGRNVIGIEMPNAKREMVFFSEMMEAEDWARNPGKLPLALGKDIGGAPVVADLARMPHLLIAGTTGSGKSVGINTMILSLLYRFGPDECRFIMIDPKMLELSVYDRIPHLLAPVVTEPPKAIGALKWTVREMERRYKAMSQLGVRNIGGYNEKVVAANARGEQITRRVQTGFDPETGKPVFEEQPLNLVSLPMIVVVIDEMADLMIVAGKEIEAAVQRLAQMARAAGIHVIMATQRPSVDVITGTIKANFPTRISFAVTSKIDSRTILGEQGAEQLLGQGDMLHMAGGGRVNRVHGPFVSDEEVERVVEYLREQGEPAYIEEVTETDEDEDSGPVFDATANGGEKGLYEQAVALVSREGKASTSFVQRHLNIGYNRAAKLIEQMEREGVVGPANHVGKREVLQRVGADD